MAALDRVKRLGRSKPPDNREQAVSFDVPLAVSSVGISPIRLRTLNESADVFPALRSTVGLLLSIHGLSDKIKDNAEQMGRVRQRVEEILERLSDAIPNGTQIMPEMTSALQRYSSVLETVRTGLTEVANRKNRMLRLLHAKRDEDALLSVNRTLDNASEVFMVSLAVQHAKSLQDVSTELKDARLQITKMQMHIKAVHRLQLVTAAFLW